MGRFGAIIKGTGSAVPERRLTNFDLEKMVETSSDWIVQRTGIKERHIAEKGTGTSDIAEPAARQAIASPLVESSIDGARAILFNVAGPADLRLREVQQAADENLCAILAHITLR